MIMKRVLGLLRSHWPQTHILLRGDGHFSNPELMQLIVADGNADFIFGLAGNSILSRKAEGLMRNARGHLNLHRSLAAQGLGPAVDGSGLRHAPAIAQAGAARHFTGKCPPQNSHSLAVQDCRTGQTV